MGRGSPPKHQLLKDRAPLSISKVLGIGNMILGSILVCAVNLCNMSCDTLTKIPNLPKSWQAKDSVTKFPRLEIIAQIIAQVRK